MRYGFEGVRCKPICNETGLGNITDEYNETCKCDEEIGYYYYFGPPKCTGTDNGDYFQCTDAGAAYSNEYFNCKDATDTLCNTGATRHCYTDECQ